MYYFASILIHHVINSTGWYPALDETNQMKYAYFTILLGKNSSSSNGCRLKSVFFFKARFHILHFSNSTVLFTKLTGRHYTKYRFSTDIASNTLIGGKGGAGPSLVHTTLEGPMEYGFKVYMGSYMISDGFCFMVTWTIFKNHLSEVDLGDRSTPTVHICWFSLFCEVWGPAWTKFHWNSIWLRAWSYVTSSYSWNPWPHYMVLEVYWDGLWTLSLGSNSQFHGHNSWLVCEVAHNVGHNNICRTHHNSHHHTKSNQNNFWWIGWKLELRTYDVLMNGKANNDTKTSPIAATPPNLLSCQFSTHLNLL